MNIVGTPCSAVHASSCSAWSVDFASNAAPGNTIVAPLVAHSSVPSTIAKQWYIGTGTHSLSSSVKRMISADIAALFTML